MKIKIRNFEKYIERFLYTLFAIGLISAILGYLNL